MASYKERVMCRSSIHNQCPLQTMVSTMYSNVCTFGIVEFPVTVEVFPSKDRIEVTKGVLPTRVILKRVINKFVIY